MLVAGYLYPFPKPKYLEQLLKVCFNHRGSVNPLVPLLTRPRCNHAKEVSEIFGACAALQAAVDAAPALGAYTSALRRPAHVYVPGDGRRPYTAAALALLTPKSWRIWSIDPLMIENFCEYPEADGQYGAVVSEQVRPESTKHDRKRREHRRALVSKALGEYADRLCCVRALAEDFVIPATAAGTLSIVVAVHSHCELADFAGRVPTPRIVVSLPCCGTCGTIPGNAPLLEYEDPDILSPHRRVIVYFDP